MQRIQLSRRIAAPPEPVWERFTDHARLAEWAGLKEVVLRQQGYPPPNGLGAIRVIRQAGLAVQEEITIFEPPRRMGYRLTAGAPIRQHRGEVTFERDGEATLVTWRVEFLPWLPGTGGLLRRLLERQLGAMLDRLAGLSFSGDEAGCTGVAQA